MARDSANETLRQIQTLYGLGAVGGLTDDQLLRRFLKGGASDAECAFRALMERHGPMVFGVCRRVLSNHHTAEDAFQATFLVLIRRAGSIGRQEKLANWLYGVAFRAAKEVKRRESRREQRERAAFDLSRADTPSDLDRLELPSILDEELCRLPGRYRAALVACEFEGKSRREAAHQLGVPEGTLSSHLARARKLLRDRLERRGFEASAWPLARLSRDLVSASPSVPTALIESTARVALSLIGGAGLAGTVPASLAPLVNSLGRSRLMTKMMTAVAAGVAVGILAIVGGVLAQQQKASVSPKQLKPEEAAKPPENTKRSILIHVVGNDGRPMSGVNVHRSVWTRKPIKDRNRDVLTNDKGEARLDIPEGTYIYRIWANIKGQVPMFAGWEEQEKPEETLPAEFTFQLHPGTLIGGIVRDEDGRGIQGVRVEVELERGGGRDGRAGPDMWLAEGKNASVTDAEGRWSLSNVPAGDDVKVLVKLDHPNYIPDTGWGSLQQEQGITMESLRNRTATIQMKRGIEAVGTVTDPEGKPVSGAIVVRGDDPYLEWGSQEVRTDDQGRFRLQPLKPGPVTVTVVASGWMPSLQKIDLRQGIKPLDIRLEKGKKLRIRFVDKAGKPIPKVYMGIDSWRKGKSLYNHKHPNVLDTQIPRQANDDGIFQWEWAPGDVVKYRFGKEGYADDELELTANGQEQVITLTSVFRISGRVTDAATGKPISKITAIPVYEFSRKHLFTDRQRLRTFGDGNYSIEGDRTDVSYWVRIEADGYRSVISDRSCPAGSTTTLDFKLEPAPAIRGHVLNAKGQPVKNARVFLTTDSQPLQLNNYEDNGLAQQRVMTDGQGAFSFPSQFERYVIIAVHDEGYAEVNRKAKLSPGDLVLKPWAQVEGRLLDAGKPVPSAEIQLRPIRPRFGDLPQINDGLWVQTDRNGHFAFPRVPPVKASLSPYLSVWKDFAITSAHSVPLEIQPAQHIEVNLGSGGTTVKGQVVPSSKVPVTTDLHKSLNWLLRKVPGIEPPDDLRALGMSSREGWNPSWRETLEGMSFIDTLDHYFVTLDQEGRFQVSGVPAGDYDFAITLYEPPGEGCLVNPVGSRVVHFRVTEDAAKKESLDLGTIEVTTKSGPRPGDPAPDFEYAISSGETATLNSHRGQYVLLDFWATWCGECVANLPALGRLCKPYENSKKLVVLGLSLDEDQDKARVFAKEHKLPGILGFPVSRPDQSVPTRYAVSSIPAYILIGPDGKMIQKSAALDEIEKTLQEVLK